MTIPFFQVEVDAEIMSASFTNLSKKRKRRQGKESQRKRPPRGKPGNSPVKVTKKIESDKQKLTLRNSARVQEVFQQCFSINLSAKPVSTGWHAKQIPLNVQSELHRAWEDGSIWNEVKHMRFVPYTYDSR
jgi:hypothetical protein